MTPGAKPESGVAWPDRLCAPVRSLPEHSRLWVALSGGLDSVLLLHVVAQCHRNRTPVGAIHVNHQLQANADETEALCRAQCQRLGVPLVCRRVTVDAGKGKTKETSADQSQGLGTVGGIEEAAREARYGVFEQVLESGDLLLMAHHGDDQAETVLFRLLRGSGVAGLAGMPAQRSLGAGQLVRPWLALERIELEQAARDAELNWVEDPSNIDLGYDRNFLRHAVLPKLKARWSGLTRRMARSAGACADSAYLSDRLAELQWAEVAESARCLDLDRFRELAPLEQTNLLHWWVRSQGFPAPAVADWQQIVSELCHAGEDREPELRGDGFSLRRFQRRLYLVPTAPEPPGQPQVLSARQPLRWGDWWLTLEPAENTDQGVPPIRVSTRQGGERLRPHPEGPSKTLKNWLQEQSVPPWERARLPLVFAGSGELEELIAVGDLWCSEHYSGSAPAAGWRLIVQRECD